MEVYVALTQSQEQQLNADIESLKKWHCSTELPRYRAWLSSLQSHLAADNLNPAEVSMLQNQLVTFLRPLLQQVTPIAVNLLSSLSNEQVSDLADNMVEKHQELEDDFLIGDPRALSEARAERTAKRAERWLGSLNGKQTNIINDWSENRAGQTKVWLKGRQNWQKALLVALKNRNEPGFEATITELINHSEAARGDAYAAMMSKSTEAMASLIQDLILASELSHLDHIARRTSQLSGDFKALTCQPGSEVASRGLTSH